VGLSGAQLTDIGAEHLKGLTQLQVLHLGNTQVSDAGLEYLRGLVLVQRELEFLLLGVSELVRASCQESCGIVPRRFIAFVPIPERGGREQGQRVSGPGSGLGPWVGARVAPLRCLILRPGRYWL
jgi:hypothetical protein